MCYFFASAIIYFNKIKLAVLCGNLNSLFFIIIIIKFLFSIIFDTCGGHYDGRCKKKKKTLLPLGTARHIYGFRDDPKHYANRRARLWTIHAAYTDTLWTRRITVWLVKEEKNTNTLDRKCPDSVEMYVREYKKTSTDLWPDSVRPSVSDGMLKYRTTNSTHSPRLVLNDMVIPSYSWNKLP